LASSSASPDRRRAGGQPDRLRLFVAVELSDSWRDWLGTLAAAARRDGVDGYRWTRPELLHVTVVFLGDQPAGRLPEIVGAVERAAAASRRFSLDLGQVGGFGGRRPRTLWVGVGDPRGGLAAVRTRLERELDAGAIPFDRKPLVPHVTLARARPAAPSGASSLARIRPFGGMAPALDVAEVSLVRSELRPDGPRYTVVGRGVLASAGFDDV
jgi:RNA 2',3'-cyclic 3'-phosphodiesterase